MKFNDKEYEQKNYSLMHVNFNDINLNNEMVKNIERPNIINNNEYSPLEMVLYDFVNPNTTKILTNINPNDNISFNIVEHNKTGEIIGTWYITATIYMIDYSYKYMIDNNCYIKVIFEPQEILYK